ncbi:uncharacterized protein LOC116286587 [Actinia tenebrosa]|uniref:Uncharacterized protein LOC116286587 n=1 Tax=Actinia tenebrosa TaxID=6105 RepID=A0A6P8GXK8_ACTTE|nr:uncharacterized protein LOC116286587 [Actinia tenebrosa]
MYTAKNAVVESPYHFLTTNLIPGTERRLVHGKGAVVTDDRGKPYIDLSSSTLNMSFGHQDPHITGAVKEQMDKVWFVASAFNNPAFIELSRLLVEVAPEGISSVNVRSCNGSDAVENAIKIARSHTRRKKLLCARHAWHGESISTLGLSSMHAYYRVGYLPDVFHAEEESLESLIELIKMHPDAAAVVLDPLGVASGMYDPTTLKQNLYDIRELCSKSGIVMVFDEIQTFGGYMGDSLFASGRYGVTPDIICIGKALGAGIPISAILCQGFLRGVLLAKEGELTYGGQPLGCVAAAAVINAFKAKRKHVSTNLAHFEEAARKLRSDFQNSDLRIRQNGFFLTVTRKDGKFAGNWMKVVSKKCLEQGLLVRKNQGKSILIKPPVIIPSDVIDECFDKFAAILKEVEIEFQKPSILYSELTENGEKPSLTTRIRNTPPDNKCKYIEALLAEVNHSLSVRKADAGEQEVNVKLLRRAGIPAAEVYKSTDGSLEYIYQPGVPMDKFMASNPNDLPVINGLVLLHQRYVEMAHDAGLSVPDRCPGNAIVSGVSIAALMDFDLVYKTSDDDQDLLFAFEEVFSTFQCVAWIKDASLQQDLSNRLCFAVMDRYGALVPHIWSGMTKYYSSPSRQESLTRHDCMRAIEAMSRSFSNLQCGIKNGR